jgi:hypothetical protein
MNGSVRSSSRSAARRRPNDLVAPKAARAVLLQGRPVRDPNTTTRGEERLAAPPAVSDTRRAELPKVYYKACLSDGSR